MKILAMMTLLSISMTVSSCVTFKHTSHREIVRPIGDYR